MPPGRQYHPTIGLENGSFAVPGKRPCRPTPTMLRMVRWCPRVRSACPCLCPSSLVTRTKPRRATLTPNRQRSTTVATLRLRSPFPLSSSPQASVGSPQSVCSSTLITANRTARPAVDVGRRECPEKPVVLDPDFLESEFLDRQADAACEPGGARPRLSVAGV